MAHEPSLTVRTKNWKISGSDALSAQFGLGIGAKIFVCSNDVRAKPMNFLWLTASAGVKAGADLSIINTVLQQAVKYTNLYTRHAGNPLSKDVLDKLEVVQSFSFQDLAGSSAAAFSAGVDAAASIGVNCMVAVGGIGRLFVLSKGTIEVKPSVEINAMNGTLGWLVPAEASFYEGAQGDYEKQKMDRLVRTPPSQRWDFGSKI